MSNSCNPVDYNPAGSSVHGILQARILEWVAIRLAPEWLQNCPRITGFRSLLPPVASLIHVRNMNPPVKILPSETLRESPARAPIPPGAVADLEEPGLLIS